MAFSLCLTGKKATIVAEELGIRSELIHRWKREYEQNSEGSFSGNGNANLTTDQREIVRLKKGA